MKKEWEGLVRKPCDSDSMSVSLDLKRRNVMGAQDGGEYET